MNTLKIDEHIINLLQRYIKNSNIEAEAGKKLIGLLMDRFGLFSSSPLTLRECASNAGKSHEWVRLKLSQVQAEIAGMHTEADLKPIQDVIDYISVYTPIHHVQAGLVLNCSEYGQDNLNITVDSLSVISDFFSLPFHMEILPENNIVVGTRTKEKLIVDKMMRYLRAEVKRKGYARVASLSEMIAPDTDHLPEQVGRMIAGLSAGYNMVSMIEHRVISLRTGTSPIYLMAKKLFSLKSELHIDVLWAAWSNRGDTNGGLSKKGLINAILLHDEFSLKEDVVAREGGLESIDTLTDYERVVVSALSASESLSPKEAVNAAEQAGLKRKTMECVFKKMPFLVKRMDSRWSLITSERGYESKFIPVENKQSVFNQYKVEPEFLLMTLTYTEDPIVSVLPGEMKAILSSYPDDFYSPAGERTLTLVRKGSYFIKGFTKHLRSQSFIEGAPVTLMISKSGAFSLHTSRK